jgi:hypothetical protein
MILVSYSLDVSKDGFVLIKVTGRSRDMVYYKGKTRVQVTRDVLFLLRVTDVPVNKDRLQSELDQLIWNKVPKRDWY